MVQRFVDASIIGWYNYLYGDNARANALIKRDNPEMSDGLIMRQRPLPETRTPENSCEWGASAEVGGIVYLARSRREDPSR